MNTHITRTERLVTGWSALIGGVVSIGMVALYFVYSGPPPLTNVLVRTLLTVGILAAFLVFATGLARFVREVRGGDAGLAGQVAVTSLVSYIGATLVATSLEAGGSLQRPDGTTDPTKDGPLAMGMAMLHGPIAHVLMAMFLVSLAAALAGHGVFSRRVLVGTVVVGGLNLAMVPSQFFGTDPEHFYAINGWGADASLGLVNVIWFAVLGYAVLRSRVGDAVEAPARVPVDALV